MADKPKPLSVENIPATPWPGTGCPLSPPFARSSSPVGFGYSLGCLLYHALVSEPPFTDKNPVQLMIKHAAQKPSPLASFRVQVPQGGCRMCSTRCWRRIPSCVTRSPPRPPVTCALPCQPLTAYHNGINFHYLRECRPWAGVPSRSDRWPSGRTRWRRCRTRCQWQLHALGPRAERTVTMMSFPRQGLVKGEPSSDRAGTWQRTRTVLWRLQARRNRAEHD